MQGDGHNCLVPLCADNKIIIFCKTNEYLVTGMLGDKQVLKTSFPDLRLIVSMPRVIREIKLLRFFRLPE